MKAICTAHVARDCAHNVFPYTVSVHVFRSVVLLPLVQPAFSGCPGAAFLIRCASVHVHGAHLSAPRETRCSASTASIKYRRSPSAPATTAVGNNNRRVNDSGEHEKVEDQRGTPRSF